MTMAHPGPTHGGALWRMAKSDQAVARLASRLLGHLLRDREAAEGFVEFPDEELPDWVTASRRDSALIAHARDIASESRSGSQQALASLQAKAGNLLNAMLVVVPLSFGALGASTAQLHGWAGPALFAGLVAAVLCFIYALLIATISSGLVRTLELRLAYVVTEAQPAPTNSEELRFEIALREVRALNNSVLAMQTGSRIAADMGSARQWAFIGALLFGVGLLLAWL